MATEAPEGLCADAAEAWWWWEGDGCGAPPPPSPRPAAPPKKLPPLIAVDTIRTASGERTRRWGDAPSPPPPLWGSCPVEPSGDCACGRLPPPPGVGGSLREASSRSSSRYALADAACATVSGSYDVSASVPTLEPAAERSESASSPVAAAAAASRTAWCSGLSGDAPTSSSALCSRGRRPLLPQRVLRSAAVASPPPLRCGGGSESVW